MNIPLGCFSTFLFRTSPLVFKTIVFLLSNIFIIASCSYVFNVRISFQMRTCVVMAEWRRCLTITTLDNLRMPRPSLQNGLFAVIAESACNERMVCANLVLLVPRPQQTSPYPPRTFLQFAMSVISKEDAEPGSKQALDNSAYWRGLPNNWIRQRIKNWIFFCYAMTVNVQNSTKCEPSCRINRLLLSKLLNKFNNSWTQPAGTNVSSTWNWDFQVIASSRSKTTKAKGWLFMLNKAKFLTMLNSVAR